MSEQVTALILAAGSGSRMNLGITKQKILIGYESVLRRTVRIFNECRSIDSIIVVARADELDFVKRETEDLEKVIKIISGGETRAKSAMLGFSEIDENTEYVAIHDAARCFVKSEIICAVLNDAKKYGAATASCKISDTVKSVDSDGSIKETIPRDTLMLMQTPQVFRADIYRKALESVDISDASITDDNMLLEKIGIYPHCTNTGKTNIKLTTQDDLIYADFLLYGEENV